MSTDLKEQIDRLDDTDKKALKLSCERELAERNPFWLIENGRLSIKTKRGELIPLKLNKAQLRLHERIKKLWAEQKLIRLFILKARQLGMSTYVEALIYSITSRIPNNNSTVIADDLDGSNYIFEMSKLYHEELEDHLKYPTKKSNEKKLEFGQIHSQIIIDTAENKEAGRKYTFRLVHLSEYAFFKRADELMLGLSQAVPDEPGTVIIKETTANGYNFAKEEWDALERGESDVEIPVFVPWYWGEDYMMPAGADFIPGDPAEPELTKDEPALFKRMTKEGIDYINERLAWRRYCIKNKCGKKGIKQQILNFKQEYPSTPLEAFKASGDCFFDEQALADQYENVPEYEWGNFVKEGDSYVFRKTDSHIFKVFEHPDPDDNYVVGGDASSGVGKDYSALVCRSKLTNRIVATYHGKADPDELEGLAAAMGHYYNDAVVAVESDKFGFAVNKGLKDHYGNIYIQEVINKKTKVKTEKFGFDTNSVTRPLMLSWMQEEIRENSLECRDITLIKECLTFIENDKTKKVEAEEGCNDDMVIACAISGFVRRMKPYKKPGTFKRTKHPKGRV